MNVLIALIITVMVLGIVRILIKEPNDTKNKKKRNSLIIIGILLVIIDGIIALSSLPISTPDPLIDSKELCIHFTNSNCTKILYSIRNDMNEEIEWMEYEEGSTIPIIKDPTYLSFKKKFLFSESKITEYTILKTEDGYEIKPGTIIIINHGSENVNKYSDVEAGWGPDTRELYTMEHPAHKITFNSITDNNNEIGDERYFVSATEYTGDVSRNYWTDYTEVEEGHEYVVRIYVHNNAASNLNYIAHNVRANIYISNAFEIAVPVEAEITCPNADPVSVWDGTTFYSKDGRPFTLVYVENSLKYYSKAGTFRLQNENDVRIPVFQEEGALLGFDEMDGDIPGCIEYSGYLTFHVKPLFQN